jgi:CRP-like cAMP-binding protein
VNIAADATRASSHALIRRLEMFGPLTAEEQDVIREITGNVVEYGPRETVLAEGEPTDRSLLFVEGFGMRQRHLEDGRRHITAFHVPGDFADLHGFLLRGAEEGVATVTRCRIAAVSHRDLMQVTETQPYLTRAFWFLTLIDGAIHRQWLSQVGSMESLERLAHFLCELRDRLHVVETAGESRFALPITQEELGHAFGMSTVHVNRSLMSLRAMGLIRSEGRMLVIEDLARLQGVANYDPDYLQLGRTLERTGTS